MYARPLPPDWHYWIDGADLRLSPASLIPAGTPSWPYADVMASEAALVAFLAQVEGAGVDPETIASIRREQKLPGAAQ
jgi:hypothetical protein